eukprot:scaffold7957_cov108-Isochrysis_galbana.AAC.3
MAPWAGRGCEADSGIRGLKTAESQCSGRSKTRRKTCLPATGLWCLRPGPHRRRADIVEQGSISGMRRRLGRECGCGQPLTS